MKRKLISLLLIFLLLPCIMASASEQTLPLVIDEARLLTDAEEAALTQSAQALQSEYGIDPVILTVNSLNGQSAQTYADDYYDSFGYADDGVLFLLAMSEREWYISTCGSMIYTLTDYGIQQLGESVVWYLSEGNYYDAFDVYLRELPEYIQEFQSGSPIDGYADLSGDYDHGTAEDTLYYPTNSQPNFLISLLCGAGVALIAILIMRSSMNTKRRQHSAVDYLKAGTFHLRSHQDLFLYSNVSKVRKQQNNSSGGSSVHRSSGGRSHGGGGGRF